METNIVKYQEAYKDIEELVLARYSDQKLITKVLEYMMQNTIVSLNNYSWQEIYEISKSGKASEMFEVGSTKNFKLNGNTYTAVILGFNTENVFPEEDKQDSLHKKDYIDNNKGFAGITFGIQEIYTGTFEMCEKNSNLTEWKDSLIYSSLNEYLIDFFDAEMKKYFVPLKRYYDDTSAEIKTYLFIPTEFEVTGNNSFSNKIEGEIQYDYYKNKLNLKKNVPNGVINKLYTYWTASKYKNNNTSYVYINKAGVPQIDLASLPKGISFCFCI